MGVPVVTLPGKTFAGRHSLSHLHAIGLNEFIADSAEDYIDRACSLAANSEALVEWRNTLRDRLLMSPLCDSKRFAGFLGAALNKLFDEIAGVGVSA